MEQSNALMVVTGLLSQVGSDGVRRFLVGLRPPHRPLPNVWEFPGGKREVGETTEECLAREWAEELGVKITVGHCVWQKDMILDGQPWCVFLYVVVLDPPGQEIQNKHHSEISFKTWTEIKQLQVTTSMRGMWSIIESMVVT